MGSKGSKEVASLGGVGVLIQQQNSSYQGVKLEQG
jgi:hypothetical protein